MNTDLWKEWLLTTGSTCQRPALGEFRSQRGYVESVGGGRGGQEREMEGATTRIQSEGESE